MNSLPPESESSCEPLKILVIGGSLSGLAFALACAQRGIRTQVLERTDTPQHGGALGIDASLLMRVTGQNAYAEGEAIPFPVLTENRKASSWQAVHQWLRRRALQHVEVNLTSGVQVTRIEQDATGATAITTDGQRIRADAIIGADGHRSMVRRTVDPEQPDASYAGYLLWRGLVPEAALPSGTRLSQDNDGTALQNQAGYRLVAYPVARPGGSLEIGQRLISFAWYDAGRSELLQNSQCLGEGDKILRSLTGRDIPFVVCEELAELARRMWPDPWRAAILHALESRQIFATPITEYCPRRLCRGRLAIIGDAAHVVSPATGRGCVTGLLDAEALARDLAQVTCRFGAEIPSALRTFERERLPAAQTLAAASVAWSQAFLQDRSSVSSTSRQAARRRKFTD